VGGVNELAELTPFPMIVLFQYMTASGAELAGDMVQDPTWAAWSVFTLFFYLYNTFDQVIVLDLIMPCFFFTSSP
jgi:hypothetical protein